MTVQWRRDKEWRHYYVAIMVINTNFPLTHSLCHKVQKFSRDHRPSTLRLVCLQIQILQLSSRTINWEQSSASWCSLTRLTRLTTRLQYCPVCYPSNNTEMLSLLTISLLPVLLLCQQDTFDDDLLLHPDLVEDDFSARQSNSTSAAATSSLLFGLGAVILLTGEYNKVRINFYQNLIKFLFYISFF